MRFTLLVLFFCVGAFAGVEDSIVKTRSSRCEGGTTFQGSGTLFWHESKAYVLTSDHVVLHSNQGFCHWIFIPKLGKEIKATFLVSEWGNGLALLSVGELTDSSIGLAFNELAPQTLKAGRRVSSFGFPVGTEELSKDTTGIMENPSLEKPFYVLFKNLVHITGANAEFGMSGGASFTQDSSHFVGVLSHQKLDPLSTANELFVIPAEIAHEWVGRYLKSPSTFKIHFLEHAEGQLFPELMLLSEGFVFHSVEHDGTISAYVRHAPPHSELYQFLYVEKFNYELLPNPNLKLITDYVAKLPAATGENAASIPLFHPNDGYQKMIPMEYFAEWFRAVSEPGLIARTKVALFHDERADPLRKWANDYDKRVTAVRPLLEAGNTAAIFLEKVSVLGKSLRSIPMFPEVPPGSLVAQDFFTYEWVWKRKKEVASILRDSAFSSLWEGLQKKEAGKAKALHDMFSSIEYHLFVDELKLQSR